MLEKCIKLLKKVFQSKVGSFIYLNCKSKVFSFTSLSSHYFAFWQNPNILQIQLFFNQMIPELLYLFIRQIVFWRKLGFI